MKAKKNDSFDVVAQIETRMAAEIVHIDHAMSDDAYAIAEAVKPLKEQQKPDISRLPDALDAEGIPCFAPGDRIVIERRASFLANNPYLDTRTYKVHKVDQSTGNLSLWDDSLSQWATDNYVHGTSRGQIYKLANGRAVSTKRKRGRPRKNPVDVAPKPVELGPDGKPIKKKRGRPAGSKNRSKDIVAAEKEEKAAARKAKLAARKTHKK